MLLETGDGDSEESFGPGKFSFFNMVSCRSDGFRSSRGEKSLKIWLCFLRQRNVHVNRRVLHGWTPLMTTVCPGQIGSVKFVRLLLACGADVSLTKEHGQQALHLALGGSAQSQMVPKFVGNTKGSILIDKMLSLALSLV
jgi:hypothetical protein